MKCSFSPYEGKEKYIFVSYSHSDSEVTFSVLEALNQAGFRIWYDDGIEWGVEWPASVEAHLRDCEVCLAFHSKASVESPNCRQEIYYALGKNKKILSVYLEEVELNYGLDLQLSPYQAAFLYHYDNREEFLSRLISSRLLQGCRSADGAGDSKEHSASADTVPDSAVNLDSRLKEKFTELFGGYHKNPESIKAEISPLLEKVEGVKQRKFVDSLRKTADKDRNNTGGRSAYTFDDTLSLVPVEYRIHYSNGRPVSWEGKHFTITDLPGFKTLVFQIIKNIDYKTMTKYLTCKLLDSRQEDSGDGSLSQTKYFIDCPEEKGTHLSMLFINNTEGEIFVEPAILKDDSVKITRKPLYLSWGKKTSDSDDQLHLNTAAYDMDALPENSFLQLKAYRNSDSRQAKIFDADIDKNPIIIIDPETALPVKRELYYDEASGKWKATIKTVGNKIYFAFQIAFSDSGTETQELSDFETAQYYKDGLYDFPKDAVKAITYFEKDGSAQALYEIAVLFRSEPSLMDQDLYTDYLGQAVDMGCVPAAIESALNLIRASDPDSREEGIDLLKNMDEEIPLRNFMLGYLTENGLIDGSCEDAFHFYFKAAVKGYKPACARLGNKISVCDSSHESELKEAFMSNLDRGYEISRYCLGCILFYGLDILPQDDAGLRLLEESAEKGYGPAVEALDFIYDEDDGE